MFRTRFSPIPCAVRHVDVIDIRYWAYTAGDGLYAPEGGKNLSPRQHLRQTKLKSGGFAAIVKAIREYRNRYPDKAVTYYADMNCPSGRDGWAVLMGGGSLPDVKLPDKLSRIVTTLQPNDGIVDGEGQWCLADSDRNILVYTESIGKDVELTVPRGSTWHVHWVDSASGDDASWRQRRSRSARSATCKDERRCGWSASMLTKPAI